MDWARGSAGWDHGRKSRRALLVRSCSKPPRSEAPGSVAPRVQGPDRVPVVTSVEATYLSRKKPEARLSSLTGGHGGPSVDLEKRSPKAKGRADERTEWGWIEGLGGQVAFAEEEEEAGGDLGRVDCCTQEKTRGGKGEEGRIRSTTRVKRAIATSPSPASYFG